MTVDAADPGRGDPWGISAAALQRSVKAITVRAAENSVREAVSEASGEVWAGRARDAFVHTASILADDLGRLASRWDAEASALTAYARGVQAVKDQQQTLTHRRELAEEDIDGWRREQRTAERENLTAMAVGNGAALDDDRPRLLESRISEAEDELALVTRQWGALIDERAAVNGALLSALGEEKVTGPYGTVSGSMAAANGSPWMASLGSVLGSSRHCSRWIRRCWTGCSPRSRPMSSPRGGRTSATATSRDFSWALRHSSAR